MRYIIRRIDLTSVARLGCFLGWLIALFPALLVAGLCVFILQRVNDVLLQVKPLSVNVLGQEVARVDILNMLQLNPLQQVIQSWVQNPTSTFILIAMILLLIGGALWALIALFTGGIYNVLARLGLGLTVELEETNPLRERRG